MSRSRRSWRERRAGESRSTSASRSARRIPAMFTRGSCNACSSALSTGSKKLIPLTVVLDLARLGQTAERADASREVVERRQMLQIAAVAAEQYLAQVDQAVDAFL